MAQQSRQYELILLGATGYTGKLTAEWITTHLPSNLKWAIAGRNEKKLQAVVDELKELDANRPPPAIETATLTTPELTALALKTRLLITTVGPYMQYGSPVLAACAETGTHYLDCTGEVPWYQEMVAQHHETARRTGAIIIPQCGFDSVPADLLTYSLVSHVRKTLGAPTARVTATLYAVKSGLSGGTAGTAIGLFEHYSLSQLASAFQPFALSPVPAPHASKPPSSFPHSLVGLVSIPELGGLQTSGPMASVDRALVHRSWGLYAGAQEEGYGPRFSFAEYMRVSGLVAALALKLGLALGGLLLAFPPSRWVVAPLVRRFVIPAPGEGPARESMKRDFLCYKGLAVADTERGEKVVGRLDCAHGGYVTTGLTLSAAADVILRGRLDETEAGRLGGGIVTPATLGEQFVKKLDEFGMKIQVGL